MNKGAEKLAVWLRKRRIKSRQFAKTLGVHEATLSKLLNGKHKPQPRTADVIQEKTDGHVDVGDWLEEIEEEIPLVA